LEYQQFFKLGVDGLFSDFSGTAVPARNQFVASVPEPGTVTGLALFGLSALGMKRKQKKG
jgi:hypothetical protein